MVAKQAPLTPIAPADLGPCKICGGAAPLAFVCDFSRNCESLNGLDLPLTGVPVYYGQCRTCGFLFTRLCDAWSPQDFQAAIYNEDYATVDPEHAATRPIRAAPIVPKLFFRDLGRLSILDYGGGSGVMARELERFGAATVTVYDPFIPAFAKRPSRTFNLVTCFEVIEHVADPRQIVADLAGFLDPGEGGVLFSTSPVPDKIHWPQWFYLAPRNGHISLYTPDALGRLWSQAGFNLLPVAQDVYFAFRDVPTFADQVVAIFRQALAAKT